MVSNKFLGSYRSIHDYLSFLYVHLFLCLDISGNIIQIYISI